MDFPTDHMMQMTMASEEKFCKGDMPMVMLMEGFQWALKGESDCINLFYPGWTLDTKGKYWAAIISILILSILTEGLSKLRHVLSKKAKLAAWDEHYYYTVIQTGLHGVHAYLGYMLMLAVMTFALEFFVAVVVGLALGYVIFGGNSYTYGSTNPCCAFMDEDPSSSEPAEPLNEIQSTTRDESGQPCCGNGESDVLVNERDALDELS
eukprot:Nitzschia sp. Nitz4//scaffold25_size161228//89991//90693//NITZ4_002436-RA/size161228-snap-gene-0.10-mRNA-1//1//CDS//3329544604//1549//frame0